MPNLEVIVKFSPEATKAMSRWNWLDNYAGDHGRNTRLCHKLQKALDEGFANRSSQISTDRTLQQVMITALTDVAIQRDQRLALKVTFDEEARSTLLARSATKAIQGRINLYLKRIFNSQLEKAAPGKWATPQELVEKVTLVA